MREQTKQKFNQKKSEKLNRKFNMGRLCTRQNGGHVFADNQKIRDCNKLI